VSRAIFKVDVPLYAIGAPEGGTVVVERGAGGVFSARIKRRRRWYSLPLATVMGMVVHRIVRAEAAEKMKARKRRRKS